MRIVESLFLAAFAALPAAAQETITIATATSDTYGTYLTDELGQAVYLFTADKAETDDEAQVTCTGVVCAGSWPWVITESDPQVAGEADAGLLGTIGADGETVVTYGGWPLYYHNADEGESGPRGHGVESFGGTWSLVTPAGEPIGQ
jgi:predicted lipoprotein with Yx(FWY)xxD motif